MVYWRIEFLRLTCWFQSRNIIMRQYKEEKGGRHCQQNQTSLPSAAAAAAAYYKCKCECICACVCSQFPVQMRSEKDLPSLNWFSVLEPNLWVGAPLWKACKLGSRSSQDEWEEGAHQRAEPSGWAQIRSSFCTHATHCRCFPVASRMSDIWISLCISVLRWGGGVTFARLTRWMCALQNNVLFCSLLISLGLMALLRLAFLFLSNVIQSMFSYTEIAIFSPVAALSHSIGFN